MNDVKYYRGKRPVQVQLETVLRLMQHVVESGRADEFVEMCRSGNLSVVAEPDVVNAVKRHLAAEEPDTRNLLVARVRASPVDPGPPPTCFPQARRQVRRGTDTTDH